MDGMKSKKRLILYILLSFLLLFSTSDRAMAEETYYYIDITLFPEGYAEFDIEVDDFNKLDETIIELPTLTYGDFNISELRKKVRVSNIPDKQTHEGHIDLKKSGSGIGITPLDDDLKDFNILFTYRNYEWELHPEKYPFDYYNMSILISFPEIRTNNSSLVSTKIILPPNTEVQKPLKPLAYEFCEHPANTQNTPRDINCITDKYGNQQIIVLESHYLTKNNPAQAIYIPLEFKRVGIVPLFFRMVTFFLTLILILMTILAFKQKNIDLGLLAIVAFVFSYYQFLVINKPEGIATDLDWAFLIFIVWSLLLFIIQTLNNLGYLQLIIGKAKKFRSFFIKKIYFYTQSTIIIK